MPLSPSLVREIAEAQGFDIVRFGPADPGEDGARFLEWIEAGKHGEMDYLARNRELIANPRAWDPELRSSISLAHDYGGPAVGIEGGARVARYAVGRDYHRYFGKRIKKLRAQLEQAGMPRGSMKAATDAAPILERALALRAGIGFLSKNGGILSPTKGPFLILGEILSPLELPFDLPAPGSCGTCTRCIDACPTSAITAAHRVDARRCLSYTTIELRGSIPQELRKPQGEWLFGCDVCTEVCPFTNRGRSASQTPPPPELERHPVLDAYSLVGVLELSEADYQTQWVGTSMRRATRNGLRRNAAVVLGNLGDDAAVPQLVTTLQDEDPIVRGHAAWALGQLAPRHRELDRAREREEDRQARQEIENAIDQR